jgi:hypothetical protein
MLITNSKVVGCSIGRSAGLVPLRMSASKAAELLRLQRYLAIAAL